MGITGTANTAAATTNYVILFILFKNGVLMCRIGRRHLMNSSHTAGHTFTTLKLARHRRSSGRLVAKAGNKGLSGRDADASDGFANSALHRPFVDARGNASTCLTQPTGFP